MKKNNVWDESRVFVCASHRGMDDPLYTESFGQFMYDAADLIKANRIEIRRDRTGLPLDLIRSKLAWHAERPENEFTHMFTFDTDMPLLLSTITSLLERDVDCVSGTYFMRCNKIRGEKIIPFPCVAAKDGEYITRKEIIDAAAKNELIEVDGTGCGCLLVKSSLLRRLGSPAFKFNWFCQGTISDMEGEDSYFTRLVRSVNVPVYLDPCVIVDHYASVRVGMVINDINNKPITNTLH